MYGEVRSTQRLTPSMVRVVLGGGDLDEFVPTPYSDQYINAQFIPAGAPYTAPFDPDDLEAVAAEYHPRARRYTVRRWDGDQRDLTIDFVTHGDHGYAGPWAQQAQRGDCLQFKGPGGAYDPDPDAAWHLMAGDESALPAIGASLEALAPGARAVVLVVIDGPDDELAFTTPGDVSITWLHRRSAEDPIALLPNAVAGLDFASGAGRCVRPRGGWRGSSGAQAPVVRTRDRQEKGFDLPVLATHDDRRGVANHQIRLAGRSGGRRLRLAHSVGVCNRVRGARTGFSRS